MVWFQCMTTEEAGKIIWDYMKLGQALKKVDALFVLSSYDVRVPHYAAKLYHEGWAPRVLIAGTGLAHKADLMATDFGMTEGEYFAQVMQEAGVPPEVMLVETKSQNTGQNFEYMSEMLAETGFDPRTVLCVQKPFMERRVYATGKVWWPDRELLVTSPPLSYDEWLTGPDRTPDDTISIMVGDLQRIKEYPALGFQIEQEIPDQVWQAWEFLVEAGYNRHLIK